MIALSVSACASSPVKRADGGELAALKGAESTLVEHAPMIFFRDTQLRYVCRLLPPVYLSRLRGGTVPRLRYYGCPQGVITHDSRRDAAKKERKKLHELVLFTLDLLLPHRKQITRFIRGG